MIATMDNTMSFKYLCRKVHSVVEDKKNGIFRRAICHFPPLKEKQR